jgi:hypothetical protein
MSNKAERMRAKIEGKLNCLWCEHFNESVVRWCELKCYAPLKSTKFKRSEKEFGNGPNNWSVTEYYFKPE